MKAGIVESKKFVVAPVIEANTFIGGVSSYISTKESLASKLNILATDILLFNIVGDDIEAFINVEYSIPANAFYGVNGDLSAAKVTHYIDKGKCLAVGDSAFMFQYNLEYFEAAAQIIHNNAFSTTGGNNTYCEFHLKSVVTVQGSAFWSWDSGMYIDLRSCINLGIDATSNGVFTYSTNSNVIGIFNPALETNNAGNPDGDIQNLIDAGGKIYFPPNFEQPNSIGDLNTSEIYGTAFRLDFTPPQSTNPIDYYDVFVNGSFYKKISGSGEYITNLPPNTSLQLNIQAVDIYYNKSELSGNLVESTITPALRTANLIAYYKMNETSGTTLIDAVGGKNGTIVGGATLQAPMPTDGGVSFDGSNDKVDFSDNDDFSFTDGTNDVPFSFSFFFTKDSNKTGIMIAKRESSPAEYQIGVVGNTLSVGMFSNGSVTNRFSADCSVYVPFGTLMHATITYDGTGKNGLRFYVNGIERSYSISETGTYSKQNNTSAKFFIGADRGSSNYHNGDMSELGIWKNHALNPGEASDHYNNGNGITFNAA